MGAGLFVRLLYGGRVLYSSTLLLLSFLAGILFINIFPGFISDDYYIYRIIKGTAAPVCLNPDEIFFLFLRPLSWFSFYIDQNLFHGYSYPAKLFSLCLHLVLVYILYQLCCIVQQYFGKNKIDYNLAFLSALVFTVHPDVVMSLVYLNNRTELLMILFYAAALLVFLKYLNKSINRNTFAFLTIIFYVLSIFSKQTGIHLPLVFLFSVFILDVNKDIRRVVIIVSTIMIIIAVLVSYLNYDLINIDSGMFKTFWKKPFTIAGTLMFVSVPFAAEEIYYYFMMNKETTAVTASIILSLLLYFAVKKGYLKQIGYALILILILFYPRVFHTGGGRINTHLLLWLILILIPLTVSSGWIWKGIMILYIIILFSYSFIMLTRTAENENGRQQILAGLHNYTLKSHPKKIFVALADHAAFLDEYLYYKKYNLKNKLDEGIPLVSKFLFPGNTRKDLVVKYSVQENNIIFSSCRNDVFIGESPLNRINKSFVTQPVGNDNRGYYSYSLTLPDSLYKYCEIVFFNGLNWQAVH